MSIISKVKSVVASVLRRLKLLPQHRDFLFSYITPNSVGAEVGVWKGDFSELVLRKVTLAKFYLIDPWTFQPEFKERMYGGTVATSQADMDDIFAGVQARLARFDSVAYLREESVTAATSIPDASLDWVYIDGNHYYQFVKDGLACYFPKVKVGGYIICDDFDWKPNADGDYEVRNAITDTLKETQSLEIIAVKHNQCVIKKVAVTF